MKNILIGAIALCTMSLDIHAMDTTPPLAIVLLNQSPYAIYYSTNTTEARSIVDPVEQKSQRCMVGTTALTHINPPNKLYLFLSPAQYANPVHILSADEESVIDINTDKNGVLVFEDVKVSTAEHYHKSMFNIVKKYTNNQ